MQEIWLPVPGFESTYEVSNLGVIRSLDRRVANRWGTSRPTSGTIKAHSKNSQGYHAVHFYASSKCTKEYVHRVVAKVFVPNPLGLPQVNHIDGDKSHNAASNLEWCSGIENCAHARDTNLYQAARGEQIGGAVLTESAVIEIRALAASGFMHKELAARFGVGRKAITKVVNRQRWKHI